MKDHSKNIGGRQFPTIDFMNAGVHTGKNGSNQIDQEAFADGLEHAATLVRGKAIVSVGTEVHMTGTAGKKRRLSVTNHFELPD